ncbi:hypothetical protein IWQ62_001567 [Dispira parvispora]|uniref:Uncharacterized protein n=1 Tax=Dispira parvispora TaxID=1520584 RepID=A0A9W8E3P7_9FUNG|nr:hypothetical protein IWQ62_001567 [Dispira parvispora]
MCSNWLNAATNLSGLETLSGQTPASILRTAIKALQQSARSGTPLETNQTALVTLGGSE